MKELTRFHRYIIGDELTTMTKFTRNDPRQQTEAERISTSGIKSTRRLLPAPFQRRDHL